MLSIRIPRLAISSKLVVPCRYRYLHHAARPISTSAHLQGLELAFDYHESPGTRAHKTHTHHAPIIVLHGLFGSKKNNRSMSKALARDLGRPVYAIDLRNHGESPHDERHDYSALATDVERFIQQHKLGETTLIGHSMGAKVAMTVALRSPDMVANLIPVDNAPVDAALESDFWKYVKGMKKVEDVKVQTLKEADMILQDSCKDLPIRQFLLTNLIRAPDNTHMMFRIPVTTLAASLDDMSDFPYKNPDEIRFEKPTLFVRGTKSHYVPDETLPIIGRFFPKFELKDVEAGHWVITENPYDFKEVVVEFLNRIEDE